MKKVYCVMEGPDFPEGAPYAIFENFDEAVNFINKTLEANFPDQWKGSACIYRYSLGEKGHEVIFNNLGDVIQ